MKNLLFLFLCFSATCAFAQSSNDTSVVFIVEHGSGIDSMLLTEFDLEAHYQETINFVFSKIDSTILQAAMTLDARAFEYQYAAILLFSKVKNLENGSIEHVLCIQRATEFQMLANSLNETAIALRKSVTK